MLLLLLLLLFPPPPPLLLLLLAAAACCCGNPHKSKLEKATLFQNRIPNNTTENLQKMHRKTPMCPGFYKGQLCVDSINTRLMTHQPQTILTGAVAVTALETVFV
jgi:hypothetical protein